MVRMIDVADGKTIIVDRAGVAVHVRLAGIELVDDEGARKLMKWTLAKSWLMLEAQPGGGHFVYRSPDALFINRELVARGFARATLPAIEPQTHVVVTYLGTLLAPAAATAKSPKASGTGSERSSPSRARPSRPRQRRKP